MNRSLAILHANRFWRHAIVAGLLCVLSSCSSAPSTEVATANPDGQPITSEVFAEPDVEAVSLLGKPLRAPELPFELRTKREAELEKAQLEYDRTLHDEDAIIWLGRRQAYLGQYNNAINTFSNGLAIYPDSFKLLRHRGHRYITIRKFDLAIADLEKAATLIQAENIPDEVEQDGQPNRLNIPTSTSHTNIYYHLGLAHYLTAQYQPAERAYRRCIEFCHNDDMRVAASYWLYLSLRRSHNHEQAIAVLRDIWADMDIIENAGYLRLLLLFKGDLTVEQALFEGGSDEQSVMPDVDIATLGYGVGMWHLLKGDKDLATLEFTRVIEQSNWAAFGHIAAEAELAGNAAGSAPQSGKQTPVPVDLLDN